MGAKAAAAQPAWGGQQCEGDWQGFLGCMCPGECGVHPSASKHVSTICNSGAFRYYVILTLDEADNARVNE
jgi:hypothetical protein